MNCQGGFLGFHLDKYAIANLFGVAVERHK